jgi:hypothetical protein
MATQTKLGTVRTASLDLRRTAGYLVADRSGHLLGKVERPMYGTSPDLPDALSVKARPFSRHRLLVPAAAIAEIDPGSCVIGLGVDAQSVALTKHVPRTAAARRMARGR